MDRFPRERTAAIGAERFRLEKMSGTAFRVERIKPGRQAFPRRGLGDEGPGRTFPPPGETSVDEDGECVLRENEIGSDAEFRRLISVS